MKKFFIFLILGFFLGLMTFFVFKHFHNIQIADNSNQVQRELAGAVIIEDVILHFCFDNRPGCAEKAEIDRNEYLLITTTDEAKDQLDGIRGAYAFHKMEKSVPGKVRGTITKEKGHFPNPMAEFDVLKVKEFIDFSVPK